MSTEDKTQAPLPIAGARHQKWESTSSSRAPIFTELRDRVDGADRSPLHKETAKCYECGTAGKLKLLHKRERERKIGEAVVTEHKCLDCGAFRQDSLHFY